MRVTIAVSSEVKTIAGTACCDAMRAIQQAQALLYDESAGRYARRYDPLRIALTALEQAGREVERAHRYVGAIEVIE